jgi:hypothetical protein
VVCGWHVCYGYSVGYSWFGDSVGYAVGFSVSYSYCDEYGYSSPYSDASPDEYADSDVWRGSMSVVPDFRFARSGADGELAALFG